MKAFKSLLVEYRDIVYLIFDNFTKLFSKDFFVDKNSEFLIYFLSLYDLGIIFTKKY